MAVSPRTASPEVFPQAFPDEIQLKPTSSRINSIDLVRGIVMVIMMLDHTRDFLHNAVFQFDPLDLSQTNPVLFFTRWITHFCAPTFVFLAGTSAYLIYARGKSKRELSRFLITRGLWLILMEFTVIRLAITFNLDPKLLFFMQVIWVIGFSMVVLAALIHLPVRVIGVLGLVMIASHNLLDTIVVPGWRGPNSPVPGVGAKLWMLFHQPGVMPVGGFAGPVAVVLYPLIPWIGVMAAGYAFGSIYKVDPPRRRKLLLTIGGIATGLFILIRAINLYGDPGPWSQQKNLLFTVLSFVNTQKYPPSLLFLLMTLGPAIIALGLFESTNYPSNKHAEPNAIEKFFITFGRVPFFFYLLQWLTAHTISVVLHFAFGKPVHWLFQTPIDWGFKPGIGFNLAVVYAAWIGGVLLLYPLCKWFAAMKQRRRDWWLSYL